MKKLFGILVFIISIFAFVIDINALENGTYVIHSAINDIIWDNNNYRPSYALKYKTPIEYRTQLGFN